MNKQGLSFSEKKVNFRVFIESLGERFDLDFGVGVGWLRA